MKSSDCQKNITLAPYTSFKIGGPADYFFIARVEDDLIGAVELAKEQNLPVLILGGGSNMLISDRGWRGLVVQIKNLKFRIKNLEIQANAGVLLAVLVQAAAQAGLTGLEWAIGIPGTLGGAIYGNAGAFGQQMADAIKEIKVYDNGLIKHYCISDDNVLATDQASDAGKVIQIKRESVFAYRDSIFKQAFGCACHASVGEQAADAPKPIILSAALRLQPGDKTQIQAQLKNNVSYRCQRQPHEPSAGSVFKNIQFDKLPKKLQATIPIDKIKVSNSF